MGPVYMSNKDMYTGPVFFTPTTGGHVTTDDIEALKQDNSNLTEDRRKLSEKCASLTRTVAEAHGETDRVKKINERLRKSLADNFPGLETQGEFADTEAETAGRHMAGMRLALKRAHETFVFYAQHHRSKGDEDKAQRNADLGEMCGRALQGSEYLDDLWQRLEPVHVHPATRQLVRDFSNALLKKLAASEAKYGHTDNWTQGDWRERCQRSLLEHAAKGDPRDVAAYCAFLWHHKWPTSLAGWVKESEHLAVKHQLMSNEQVLMEFPYIIERNKGAPTVALLEFSLLLLGRRSDLEDKWVLRSEAEAQVARGQDESDMAKTTSGLKSQIAGLVRSVERKKALNEATNALVRKLNAERLRLGEELKQARGALGACARWAQSPGDQELMDRALTALGAAGFSVEE